MAAAAALCVCCGHARRGPAEYFAIQSRGVPVGWLSRVDLGPRRDSAGPFVVTGCRLYVRRWADGRGVVSDELAVVAARRPDRPVHYLSGRWGGGAFRYRLGRSWHLKIVDEFGNVAESRGARPPAFVTFEGAPLPLATAPREPNRTNLTALELTSGRTSSYRGRDAGGFWTGRGADNYVRVWFDADGAVVNYVDGTGYGTSPSAEPQRPRGFLYQSPAVAYLPFILPPRPTALRLHLPVAATTSRPPDPGDLSRAGQSFDGRVAGNIITGTFTVEPSQQAPLESAAEDPDAAPWGWWPAVEGRGELERLAASYRRQGKSVRFATGLGVFAGNLLAGYDWLEVDGRAVAAPGRPVPQLRVALATAAEPATLTKFALAGEPKVEGRGAHPITAEIPGLKNAAELFYEIYCGGAPAGGLAAWYEKSPPHPPAVYIYGEIFDRVVEGVTPCEPLRGVSPTSADGPAFAEFIALGAAVAVPAEDAKPPFEFCVPAGGRPARVTWQGFQAVVVGGERFLGRVFRLEPGPFRACYTYDGILVALEWHNFAARLASLPARAAPAAEAVPAAATTETGGVAPAGDSE